MFAEPEDLGYDTTMRRVNTIGASPQFDISVFEKKETDSKPQHRWYRTRRLLSNIGAEAARGRGTRVWEVVRLDKHDEPVGPSRVLKDCWIDYDRTREGDIMKRIIDSARTPTAKSILEDCLLTVECHGDVYINGRPDDTHALMRRGNAVPTDGYYPLQRPARSRGKDERMYPRGSFLFTTKIIKKEIIGYDDKFHYRIVFEEVGISIDKLDSALDIFKCLTRALPGKA